jgi:hypothetical protein
VVRGGLAVPWEQAERDGKRTGAARALAAPVYWRAPVWEAKLGHPLFALLVDLREKLNCSNPAFQKYITHDLAKYNLLS